MNQRSTSFSLAALAVLFFFAIGVSIVFRTQSNNPVSISADINTSSIPFKQGDNVITIPRGLDLSQRIIGLNGSLITIEEAKRRGIIDGIFDDKGKELNGVYLLSPNSSFIIRVKDISSAPALFF